MEAACLGAVEGTKDYLFDGREYNPESTVYGVSLKQ
jgi:hypothetical protein